MKVKVCLTIEQSTLERFRNAMYWTPGTGMSALVERFMDQIVDQLEEENKQQFLPRSGDMRKGRIKLSI